MTRFRADASATGSPEDTMSAPFWPNTVSTAFRSPVFAALTRASAASSAVLNDCWACAAAIANASTAAVNKPSLARVAVGLVKERIVIIASSAACESRIQSVLLLSIDARASTAITITCTTARSSPQSVPNPGDAWDPGARCDPLVVSPELQAELVVEDLKVAVSAAHDRLRHDRLHFLRHDADIDSVTAVIAEAIETKAVLQMAEKRDVVLKRNI